mgnify:CR=1 FL=1
MKGYGRQALHSGRNPPPVVDSLLGSRLLVMLPGAVHNRPDQLFIKFSPMIQRHGKISGMFPVHVIDAYRETGCPDPELFPEHLPSVHPHLLFTDA